MAILNFPCRAASPHAEYTITIELDAGGDVIGVKVPDLGNRSSRMIIAEQLKEAAELLANGPAND